MSMFNDFIGKFQLKELFISGAKFTWSNKQKHPILVKLDKMLVTYEWEDRFPKCFAWSKAWVGLDHCPLVLILVSMELLDQNTFSSKNNGSLMMAFTKWFLTNGVKSEPNSMIKLIL